MYKKVFDFIRYRINLYLTFYYKRKIINLLYKYPSTIYQFIYNNEDIIIPGMHILNYKYGIKNRKIFDLGNRYLPYRWHVLAEQTYKLTQDSINWHSNSVVLVLGAGQRNPYSLALFFLLNGASKVYCLEPKPLDVIAVMSTLHETV